MTDQRLAHLYELLSSSGADAVAFNPGPTMLYLTDLHFHLMERPTVLLVATGKTPVLVLPELESGKVAGSRIPLSAITFNDNPATWPDVFQKVLKGMELTQGRVLVEANQMRFLEIDLLKRAAPGLEFVSGGSVLTALRIQKDASEIAAMKKAVQIAQAALQATLNQFKTGMTEKEIASELMIQLYRAGSGEELPFMPIVASGPNSANPHAVPTERKVQPGDLLLIDYGASYNNYYSDLTRTFAVGGISPELKKIYAAVMGANEAGRLAGAPGVQAGKIDQAARKIIDVAGYGAYFTHRTGHGLGMESHEEPYMFGENSLVLREGMVYTVEPGIYMEGVGGVRIEDNIVVTASGCESLSDFPRELTVIGG